QRQPKAFSNPSTVPFDRPVQARLSQQQLLLPSQVHQHPHHQQLSFQPPQSVSTNLSHHTLLSQQATVSSSAQQQPNQGNRRGSVPRSPVQMTPLNSVL